MSASYEPLSAIQPPPPPTPRYTSDLNNTQFRDLLHVGYLRPDDASDLAALRQEVDGGPTCLASLPSPRHLYDHRELSPPRLLLFLPR